MLERNQEEEGLEAAPDKSRESKERVWSRSGGAQTLALLSLRRKDILLPVTGVIKKKKGWRQHQTSLCVRELKALVAP